MGEVEKLAWGIAIFSIILIIIGFIYGSTVDSDTDYDNDYTGNAVSNQQDSPSENIQEAYDGYKETGEIDWELIYGDDWEGFLKGKLEEEGYRVISISVMDISSLDPIASLFGDENVYGKRKIRVEMESLGNRADQIQEVIFKSALIENKYGFWIEIHSPTDTCTYVIRWADWQSCLNTYGCSSDTFVTEASLLICK